MASAEVNSSGPSDSEGEEVLITGEKPRLVKRVAAVTGTLVKNPSIVLTELTAATIGSGFGYSVSLAHLDPKVLTHSSILNGVIGGALIGSFIRVCIPALREIRDNPVQEVSLREAWRVGESQVKEKKYFPENRFLYR